VQEKEGELAKLAEQRKKLIEQQMEQLQEAERKHKDEISNLRSQLKQLTQDFQYNLQLLHDRDIELDAMENQLAVQKEVDTGRMQVCAPQIDICSMQEV
jgi:predicted nuclease with TOPRIM domain